MIHWITVARSWHVLVRFGIATIAVSAATALQLLFEVGFPGKPFVLYLVVVAASALLGRMVGFLAVVETSIACGLFFEPVYSFRVTYAIDLVAVEVYAVGAALSVEAFCRLVDGAPAERSQASSARIQREDAEERLAYSEAQLSLARTLADSEARFQATFENAAVGIAHVALDGRWLRVNDALCGLLGYPVDELLTKTFRQITYPDDLTASVRLGLRLLWRKYPVPMLRAGTGLSQQDPIPRQGAQRRGPRSRADVLPRGTARGKDYA